MKNWTFSSIRRDGLTLIAGLGETGVAAARWCLLHAAAVRILDTRDQPAGLQALLDLPQSDRVDIRLGMEAWTDDVLTDVHTIVLSPGLSPVVEPVSSLLQSATRLGIEIIGEIELFARALLDMAEQGYTPSVLAVTGTNGKTTVTAMARQLAEASGFSAVAAGNISPAALAALEACIKAEKLPEVWVLELSSFQLHTTCSLRARAAVILNISQDHLDWHGSYDAYCASKAGLLHQADIAVVNRDDAVVSHMVESLDMPGVRTFGSDLPVLTGDVGLADTEGLAWLCAAEEAADVEMPARQARGAAIRSSKRSATSAPVRLMPVEALRVRGRHNALNALAAMALVRSLGAGWAPMLHALRDYGGEPHRMELVRIVAGVEFVNDSKGTNVGATAAALQGQDRPVVLIAGGLAKNQDFAPLTQAARGRVKAAVLMGQDAGQVAVALEAAGVPCIFAANMAVAVRAAFDRCRAGDAVILSPACASMDMFSNYIHRGQCFVDEVNELALDQGDVA